jgi:hypothetical protein
MFIVRNTPQEPNPTLGGEKRPRLGKCDLLAGAFFQPPTVNTGRQFEENSLFERTKLECYRKQRTAVENFPAKPECL